MKNQSKLVHLSSNSKQEFKIAAHDLNNLLNNVLNSVELLKERLSNDHSEIKLVEYIEKNSLLASEIVQQISNSNSTNAIQKTEINLIEIIEDIVELSREKSDIPIIVEVNLNGDNNSIWGNVIEIKRVLFNLILNAQETAENSKINIHIKNNNDSIKINIIDKGKGIPQNLIHKIFDEGFSTKPNNTSRGLGLSIVKKIVENHSGKIEVSNNKDKGAKFVLCFPIYHRSKKDIQYTKKKVLIAEDDAFQREVLKDLLTAMKINVFTASNGIEALEVYTSTKPDLLFIDEMMPGMTGTECTEKIREMDKNSQIVLVTGSNLDERKMLSKVTKILKKPYNFEMVRSTLEELL